MTIPAWLVCKHMLDSLQHLWYKSAFLVFCEAQICALGFVKFFVSFFCRFQDLSMQEIAARLDGCDTLMVP